MEKAQHTRIANGVTLIKQYARESEELNNVGRSWNSIC